MVITDLLPYVFFVFGLVIGSFLNVCIYRIPRGESVVFPPSHCPGCSRRIAARDLIPVLSYLRLKGRCRFCGSKISPIYPFIELLTGLLFAAVYLRFGHTVLLYKVLFLVPVLIIVTFIDLRHYIIPDKLTVFALAGGVILNIYTRDLTLFSSLLGLISAGAFLLLIAIVSKGGMGGGDIKFAAVIGLFLGWPQGLFAVFLSCMLAGMAGLVLLLTRVKGRKDAIPFGPFLCIGALAAIWRGEEILTWYLRGAWF
ncbi:prepilin peptidase [Pelotomaculum propionicicum]|uniref:Type 4 prepilin-like proteins leader peptide-processing enzyme n=1 Tax=Pelotomaculum propionicicum TaxID=258475 RepID=A0A4Y7RLG8_9FIRM|nr:A24 family peptidase [Pelotomaculum propionicicum]NLI11370.1 prepilin peptidase [Peptococcaceae bacterium]TEB09589.1 Type 4 prepilin-like proteins leader peptide-processing enzyme [Pelotomaculum propionicicum]